VDLSDHGCINEEDDGEEDKPEYALPDLASARNFPNGTTFIDDSCNEKRDHDEDDDFHDYIPFMKITIDHTIALM